MYDSGYGLKVDVITHTLYATFWNSDQIHRYNTQGQSLFPNYGESSVVDSDGKLNKNKLSHPLGITLDLKNLYVCDYGNHRIQIIEKESGRYLSSFGKYGRQDGTLNLPVGIYHYENYLYITDEFKVQIFTIQGEFVQRIGIGKGPGRLKLQFSIPIGIVIVKQQLYIVDSNNQRIQVFI